MVVKVEEDVLRAVVCETLASACKKTLPFCVGFTIEGSLNILLSTEETFKLNINETGEGTAKYNKRKTKARSDPEYSLSTKPTTKRKRGRPRRVRIEELGSDSDNDGGDLGTSFTDGEEPSTSVAANFPNLSQLCTDGTIKQEVVAENENGEKAEADVKPTVEETAAEIGERQLSTRTQNSRRIIDSSEEENGGKSQGEDGGGFECSFCGMMFDKRRSKRRHEWRTHYKALEKHECPTCGKHLSRLEHLRRHMRIHTSEKKFTCGICSMRFMRLDTLKTHEKNVHSEDAMHKRVRRIRRMIVQSDTESSSSSEEEDSPLKEEDGKPGVDKENSDAQGKAKKKYMCDMCGVMFTKSHHLRRHEREVHAMVMYNHECPVCRKMFTRQEHLQRHLVTHTDEKSLMCSKCDKRFSRIDNLRMHEKTVHCHDRPFVCTYCGKAFGWKKVLQDHERIHTGEKPFTCSHCGKGFHSRNGIQEHERTHTGEKPFECQFCHQRFNRKRNKNKHEEKQHAQQLANPTMHQEALTLSQPQIPSTREAPAPETHPGSSGSEGPGSSGVAMSVPGPRPSVGYPISVPGHSHGPSPGPSGVITAARLPPCPPTLDAENLQAVATLANIPHEQLPLLYNTSGWQYHHYSY